MIIVAGALIVVFLLVLVLCLGLCRAAARPMPSPPDVIRSDEPGSLDR